MIKLHTRISRLVTTTAAASALILVTGVSYAGPDEDAAKALMKRNDCGKCHAPAKEKKGPSLKKIAEKYHGKADAHKKIMENLTTNPKVKLSDGTEEEHKAIDTKDPKELKNLIDWILSN